MMKKYFWPIKSFTFFLGLLCILGVFALLGHFSYTPKSSCEIEFLLKTTIPVEFGIYYDLGEGLNQEDHQSKRVETINQKTKLSFCIPVYGKLRTLRFDPATQPLKMDIYSITLYYDDGTVFKVPFESLQPGEQILSHEWDDTTLSFETKVDATDPHFYLTKLSERVIQKETMNKIFHYGGWLLCGFLMMSLGKFIYLFFFLGM